MAAAFAIQLIGFDKLERRLAALPAKIERSVFRKTLRATGTKIARRVKSGTPRDMGAGRRSVKVKVKVRRGGAYARIGYTKKPGFYLGLRERGSRRQTAKPFFDQAVGPWRNEATRDFGEALERAVEKVEVGL